MEWHLFETLYASPETGLRYLERHLARLVASARALGFPCDAEAIRTEALRWESASGAGGPQRVRMRLERSGSFDIEGHPLAPLRAGTVGLLLGAEWDFVPRRSFDPMLLHKSSLREEYDRAWRFAETRGAWDVLFTNERGELTEGGRSNLFLAIGGTWWTPPLACGLLPGIERAVLLKDTQMQAVEKVLFPNDLYRADRILLTNSLRGRVQAKLVQASPYLARGDKQ
jgi:para-aminobenzoate synthetase/4-amino-4-deoxychorismate lyase